MGFRAIFQQAAKTAFKVAGDLIVPCVYEATVDTGFDETQIKTSNPDVLFGQFSMRERENNPSIQFGDVSGLIMTAGITAVPKDGDKLTDPSGVMYWVVAYTSDPAGATYRLHLRKI